ncbi:hypothetical protein GCK72_021800 [Caenorhabditis remanei]|uniref:DUF38 domain-containing protein n=1 Tax=Caenorhabditis remanei TaxID=31234 RepID=A0A6A5GKW9_CAERE|nr:hypothetical protein GCK72_021800 [Caenorhabditis remanei]KAF1755231.1 hypothetical protein GCK72_021800 [Caenorhabditis remanei]
MSLLDLHDDDLLEIAGKLDLRGISNLRKVNQRLRNLIETRPPTHDFSSVTITADDDLKVVYDSGTPAGQETISYSNLNQNCLVNQKRLVGQDYREIFCRDFELNIRYQKGVLDRLCVVEGNNCLGLKRICEILQSRDTNLPVKFLRIFCDFQRQVFQILSAVEPLTLKSIHILLFRDSTQQLDEYERLEQWRSAEELDGNVNVDSSTHFRRLLHFRKVTVCVERLFLKDLIVLRDAFLRNPRHQKFKSYFPQFPELQEFMDLLGMEKDSGDLEEDSLSKMYFRIPNSSDVLAIGICLNLFKFRRLVVAEKYAGKDVIEDIGEVGFFQR